jgi:hypothetical protein
MSAPERVADVGGAAIERLGWSCAIGAALLLGTGLVVGFQIALAILCAIGFLGSAVGLRYPVVGLLSTAVLCTVDPVMNEYVFSLPGLRWNTYNYWLLFVAVLFLPTLVRRRERSVHLLGALAAVLGLELLISPDLVTGANDMFAVLAVFGLLVYFVNAARFPAAWFWAGIVCGVVAAVGGLVFYLQEASLPPINPNAWAFYPISALVAICYALRLGQERRHGQLMLGALAAVNVGWVFLSGSRGGLLMALICSLFLLVSMRGLGQRTLTVGVAALVALTAATQFTGMQEYTLRRIRLLSDSEASLTDRTSGRSALVEGGWYLFLEHPLGVGTGGFADTWKTLDRREESSEWGKGEWKTAHAGWVKILVENGIIGFACLAGLVVHFAVAGLGRAARPARRIGWLASAVLGLALISTEYQSKALWFTAAGTTVLLGADSPLRRRAP